MARRDVDFEHEIRSGDYGLVAGEWYACPPLYINHLEKLPIIYLERPAAPPWVITDHGNGTISVDPEFKLGDQAVSLRVRLDHGRWTSL